MHKKPRSPLEVETRITGINAKQGPIIISKDPYVPVAVREFLPTFEKRRVHDLVGDLIHGGLKERCVHYTHHLGGNKPSLHFIWKVRESDSEGELM